MTYFGNLFAVDIVFSIVNFRSTCFGGVQRFPLVYLGNIVETVRKCPIGYLAIRQSLIWSLEGEKIVNGFQVETKK